MTPENTNGICYTGPFLDSSGYGEANRNAIKAFHEAGANIKTKLVRYTKGNFEGNKLSDLANELSSRDISYKVKVIHTTPDDYHNHMEKGVYHIGHLFWETSALPEDWVKACNKMDEIWCGAKSNAEAIINSGVKVPVHIFPQAINTDIPEVRPFVLPNYNGFVFYSIFEWNERKNPRRLLEAYWKEFKGHDDVCLLIKTHKGDFTPQGTEEIIADARRWKNNMGFDHYPRVVLCTNKLNEEEKWRIHRTGDIYITAHRGEGWGIPFVEATLNNKPSIVVRRGGAFEYFNGKHMFIAEHKMVDIDKVYNRYYAPGMQWAEVDEASLRKHMRTVYEYVNKPSTNRIPTMKSRAAQAIAKSLFNYKIVGGMMLERVNQIYESLESEKRNKTQK